MFLTLFAVLRMAAAAIWVSLGAVVILLCSWLPIRIRGITLPGWIVSGLAAGVCRIFRVYVDCRDVARLRSHTGFIFPNHLSLLDPLVLLSVTPVRFVAAQEVAGYPVIGWITKSIGTVFVTRQDRQARRAARNHIIQALQAVPHPPIVLFPEGRLGPGHRLYPFRYGAFAMAVADNIPYMLCGMRYQPLEIAIWRGGEGETLWAALWRLARWTKGVQAELLPLPSIQPEMTDEPAQLAETAQTAIAAVLSLPSEPATPPPLQSLNAASGT